MKRKRAEAKSKAKERKQKIEREAGRWEEPAATCGLFRFRRRSLRWGVSGRRARGVKRAFHFGHFWRARPRGAADHAIGQANKAAVFLGQGADVRRDERCKNCRRHDGVAKRVVARDQIADQQAE